MNAPQPSAAQLRREVDERLRELPAASDGDNARRIAIAMIAELIDCYCDARTRERSG